MTGDEQLRLDTDGYLVIENLMDPSLLNTVRRRVEELVGKEGGEGGDEVKQEPHSRRLANLVDKGEVFERVIETPRILDCMEHVLGPHFKLSSLNVRSADPDNGWSQPLHADSGAVADDRGYWVCNTLWMLDDFTADNGPIRMVPGSHRWRQLPQESLENPRATHPQEIVLTASAGTVVIMNAHMWHGGLGNRSAKPRAAMHGFFARRDKPQQQYQKKLLRAEVQEKLTPELRRI